MQKLREIIRKVIREELLESRGMTLQQAKEEAKKESRANGGSAQHVNELSDGSYEVSDFYDYETTIWSWENGREL